MLRYRIYSLQYGFAATVLRALARYFRQTSGPRRRRRAVWLTYRIYSLRHGFGATVLRVVVRYCREAHCKYPRHHAA